MEGKISFQLVTLGFDHSLTTWKVILPEDKHLACHVTIWKVILRSCRRILISTEGVLGNSLGWSTAEPQVSGSIVLKTL